MSQRSPRRHGFTLVELLVVIAIIVILAGLLIPAVGVIRARARRAKCANNLQQMAAAVLEFESSRGRFPGSRELIAKRATGPGQQKWATWQLMIMPNMDQGPLFDLWDDPQVTIFTDPTIPTFVERLIPSLPWNRCPSDTTLADSDPNLDGVPPDTSYVANGGMMPITPASQSQRSGPLDPSPYNVDPGSYLLVMDRNTGVFHDLVRKPNAKVTVDMLYDGAGNVLMLSENLQAQWWFFNGDVNQFGSPQPHLNRLSTMFYYMYAAAPQLSTGMPVPTQVVTEEMRINGLKRSVGLRPSTARPSSEHGRGVNMAFCDRSVKFIRQDIDYHVYTSLMTPRNTKSHVPWREFILNASDYLND